MGAFSHALYIDESGNAYPGRDILRLWVTVGIAIPFDQKARLDLSVEHVLRNHFHPRTRELKGAEMPHGLLRTSSTSRVADALATVMNQVGAHIWIVGTEHAINSPPGLPTNAQPKQIARHLLFDRVNGFLNLGYYQPNEWLIIWDISDSQELQDFSRNVATFQNSFTQAPLNPRLAPAVLGGLSHDWRGLQIADVFSHFAMHKIAIEKGLAQANAQKASDFDQYLYPCLQRTSTGQVVGWKIW